MADQFPPIPAGSTVRQNADGSWQYQRRSVGPWCDMPAPQKAAPWAACPSPQQPATVAPTLSDCIALAVCTAALPGSRPCQSPCGACRAGSAAVAHQIAAWLRERHVGASTTADLLDGVGCHQHAPRVEVPALSSDQRAMALAVGRELRRPNV